MLARDRRRLWIRAKNSIAIPIFPSLMRRNRRPKRRRDYQIVNVRYARIDRER